MAEAIPTLEGDAAAAVDYRGGHLQIIASAGSGKTEVVAQRVALLLKEGVPPAGMVAFTFTERAARSLKTRIEKRVAALMGTEVLDKLNGMFVGTIHSYCFRVLQLHVPRVDRQRQGRGHGHARRGDPCARALHRGGGGRRERAAEIDPGEVLEAQRRGEAQAARAAFRKPDIRSCGSSCATKKGRRL